MVRFLNNSGACAFTVLLLLYAANAQAEPPPTRFVSLNGDCALSDTGEVFCLAFSNSKHLELRPLPGLKDAKAVSSASKESTICAVSRDDTLRCVESTGAAPGPRDPDPSRVMTRARAVSQSCGIDTKGTARCGSRPTALRDGKTLGSVAVSDAVAVSDYCGGYDCRAAVLRAGGELLVFERGANGRSIVETREQHPEATAIFYAARHQCLLLAGGSVMCSGNNVGGAVGTGSDKAQETWSRLPLKNVTQLALGFFTTCATTASGRVHCWGEFLVPVHTQAGTKRSTPVPRDIGVQNVAEVAIPSHPLETICVRTTDGKVACIESAGVNKKASKHLPPGWVEVPVVR